MKMWKRITTLLLTVVVSVGLVACGGTEETSLESDGSSEETMVTEEEVTDLTEEPTKEELVETTETESLLNDAEADFVVVEDELDREVRIPRHPQRVLALTSAAMQALIEIEMPLVGKVEEYKIDEDYVDLPSVGKASEINIEAVYALEPDLIIAANRFHASMTEELERSGAAVFFFDPDKIGDIPIVDMVPYLAEFFEKEELAEAHVDHMEEVASELEKQVHEQTDIETGVILQDGDTIRAAQTASGYGSLLTMLDIENIVPADLPGSKKSPFVPFDVEEIIVADPDLILITASSNDPDSNKATLEKFKNDPKWSELSAVKNNNLIMLPFSVNANRATPEDMLRTTAEVILKNAGK